MPRISIDRPTFLSNLRKSGLLSHVQLGFVEKHLPETDSSRRLARVLVELGLLTRFQAERLLAGRTNGFILGQYRILEQIGRGGMGRVYKAEHRAMTRIVAIKVLAPEFGKEGRGLQLFLREVRAAAQIVHPNVVHAYDANEICGRYFLVLEYIDGPNLDQLVRKQGPLEIGLACDYIRQAATGLAAAHARGMVHRDIKPSNILVQTRGPEGTNVPGLVKINDFGLARLQAGADLEELSNTGGTICLKENTIMGTPDFLSPEQARSLHKTDIRSDLYSLGCAFYFLLTGEVPYPGGTSMDKLIRHSIDVPAPLSSLRPDTPAPIVAIVRRLLAKDADARFQTPTELAQALEPYAVSGPIPWAPPPAAPLADELEPPPDTLAVDNLDVELLAPDDLHFDVTGADDFQALHPTIQPDLSPTPLTSAESEPLIRLEQFSKRRSRGQAPTGKAAFLIAAAIVMGVLGAVALLAALFGWR